jgi:hypothetical protein
MDASVNGAPLIDLRIVIPRKGSWYGELSADADAPLDFKMEISIGDVSFSGTARTSSMTDGTAVAEFVAGKAGLSKPIDAQAFNNVPLSIPLRAIANAAGEALASTSLRDVMDIQKNAWCIRKGKCGAALNVLVDVGAADVEGTLWRFLPSGQLWVGVDQWEEVKVEYEALTVDPKADHLLAYMEHPGLLPGTTFLRRKVSHVEHHLEAGRLRTGVWFE